MSCSATLPLSARATAPEALCLLHQRLLLAEEEAEGLIRDMGALGVSRDQILGSGKTMDTTQSPLTMQWFQGDENTLWQQWDSVVNRVCRMESLLQTLKLTIFCLETERELDPSHTGNGLYVILLNKENISDISKCIGMLQWQRQSGCSYAVESKQGQGGGQLKHNTLHKYNTQDMNT